MSMEEAWLLLVDPLLVLGLSPGHLVPAAFSQLATIQGVFSHQEARQSTILRAIIHNLLAAALGRLALGMEEARLRPRVLTRRPLPRLRM